MKKKDFRVSQIFQKDVQTDASELVLKIYRARKYHESYVHDNGYKNHFKVFEDYFAEFTNSVMNMGVSNSNWKEHNTYQAILFSKIPKTLFSAFHLASLGDYHQSVSTLRIAYESVLRVLYIQKHPEKALSVVLGEQKSGFKASRVLVDEYEVVKNDLLYEVMSYPVHSLKNKIASDLVAAEKKGEIVLCHDIGGFVESEYKWAMHLLISVLYFSIRVFTKIFQDLVDDFCAPRYKPVYRFLKLVKLEGHMRMVSSVLRKL